MEANRGAGAPYWRHVAVTKASTASSTDAIKLYFDGIQQASDKCYASTSTDSIWIPGNPSSSANLFKGYMDEVRVWNTERSASDISTSTYEISATSTGLLGLWRFNGTSTDIRWGNATSGQFGAPAFTSTTPFGHFILPAGWAAVNTSTHKLNWASSTVFATQWNAAIDTWNGNPQRPIIVTSTSYANATLIVDDASSTGYPWSGSYCPAAVPECNTTKGLIWLNGAYLGQFDSAGKQKTVTHELGHALGLDESWGWNVMYYTHSEQTYLGVQDLKDYNYLWGN